jgi:hypothetical protein
MLKEAFSSVGCSLFHVRAVELCGRIDIYVTGVEVVDERGRS